MKKFFSILIISLFICEIGLANTFILYCSDAELAGFDGKDQYSKLTKYKPLKFKIKIDMDNKTISSNSLGGFNNKTEICKYWEAYSKYDPVLECMDLGYYIAINLKDYKYTRSRGYGYAFSSGDDIGFGYGTCEEF